MGKKSRSKTSQLKKQNRKVDKSSLPPPPAPVETEVGSAKLLDEPKIPGSGYKALDREGYDDGGVADLTLVIDLDDQVLRRKRGENAYFSALKADLLPRVTTGSYANMPRRDQKIKLAKLLFSEEEMGEEDASPSEVYIDNVDGSEDEETKAKRLERLKSAKFALRLSTVLREPACASLALAEISKRYLNAYGKEGAEDALRCADKAIEIASDGFYDSDDIAMEAEDEVKVDPKYEKNATYPGLSNPTVLKLQPLRVSQLCHRSAYLHHGNALAALGRDDDARASYEKVLPLLENEPRCTRLDWERSSVYVNIGNTYSRQGNFDKANELYEDAIKLGQDHVDHEGSNMVEGMGIMIVGMRARAFALKKAGRDEEGKTEMKKVIELQLKLNVEREKQKEIEKAEAEAAQKLLEQQNAENPAGSEDVDSSVEMVTKEV